MEITLNLDKNKRYVVAVSGGVDSMCLLNLLIAHNYQIVCVHFDHQKRSDSKLDNELILSVCKKHNITYHLVTLDLLGSNFQERARNLRQSHLENIAKQYNTNYIITAHHLDDNLETILIRLTRGASLLGLSGLREITKIRDFYYLKPLLNYDKETIINYAKLNNVSYLEDSSNSENYYLRNKLRNIVIPVLKKETGISNHIMLLSKNLYQIHLYLRAQTKEFLNNENCFDLVLFKKLDDVVKKDVIAYLLESVNCYPTYNYIEEIIKQLLAKKPNIIFSLNDNYNLVKAYNIVKLVAKNLNSTNKMELDIIFSHKPIKNGEDYVQICYNKLDFPLLLRKRRNGDVLNFTYGSKKLKSFLIDKKIPLSLRDELDVITDSNDVIIWIPNLYINQTLGNENKIYIKLKGAL